MPRQQRDLAADDAQPRAPGPRPCAVAALLPGEVGVPREPGDDLVRGAAPVEVDLDPGLVLEDQHGIALAPVEERLDPTDGVLDGAGGDAPVAREGGVAWLARSSDD